MRLMPILAGVMLAPVLAVTAAEFQNLGFELADTNRLTSGGCQIGFPYPYSGSTLLQCIGEGPSAALVPGWNVSIPGQTNVEVGFNWLPEYGAGVSIMEPWVNDRWIDGKYALGLQPDTQVGSAAIAVSQTGIVPAGTGFFRYRYRGTPVEVYVNGEYISPLGNPLPPAMDAPSWAHYEISRFAGQEVALTLASAPPGLWNPAFVLLDSLMFLPAQPSLQAQPSPGAVVLAWSDSSGAYTLQTSDVLRASKWTPMGTNVVSNGDVRAVTIQIDKASAGKLYRLMLTTP